GANRRAAVLGDPPRVSGIHVVRQVEKRVRHGARHLEWENSHGTSSRSTMLAAPSTGTRSPARQVATIPGLATTAGSTRSRANTAECESTLPRSTTMAAAA